MSCVKCNKIFNDQKYVSCPNSEMDPNDKMPVYDNFQFCESKKNTVTHYNGNNTCYDLKMCFDCLIEENNDLKSSPNFLEYKCPSCNHLSRYSRWVVTRRSRKSIKENAKQFNGYHTCKKIEIELKNKDGFLLKVNLGEYNIFWYPKCVDNVIRKVLNDHGYKDIEVDYEVKFHDKSWGNKYNGDQVEIISFKGKEKF